MGKDISNLELIVDTLILPDLIVTAIFVALGFLFLSFIPPVHHVLFWCTLLIVGNVSLFFTILIGHIVISTDKNVDFYGSLVAVGMVAGFVYLGELIWYWIMSVELLPVVGIIILIQFIGHYCLVVLFSTGKVTIHRNDDDE